MLYDSGSSNPMLCDNLEGVGYEEDGREVQERGGIGISMADSC